MDISFLGKPHEWDPRRLYSQTGADWQFRVDFDRLRKERLEKLRASMTKNNLGALILFAGANIRYATASCRRAANQCCSRRPVRTCNAPRSTCRGWKDASGQRSPGSGRKARFR